MANALLFLMMLICFVAFLMIIGRIVDGMLFGMSNVFDVASIGVSEIKWRKEFVIHTCQFAREDNAIPLTSSTLLPNLT